MNATLQDILNGPRPWSREERAALAEELVAWLRSVYAEDLLAVALYGSAARGGDGPYSDVELWAALRDDTKGAPDLTYEWVHGPGKAEVNVATRAAWAQSAAHVDEAWATTHGQFVRARALWEAPDARGLVEEIAEIAVGPSEAVIKTVLAEAIVGNIYELMGKLRGAAAEDSVTHTLVSLSDEIAAMTALAARHTFVSSRTKLAEAGALSPPEGAQALFDLVASGALSDRARAIKAAQSAWAGIGPWALTRGLSEALVARARPKK